MFRNFYYNYKEDVHRYVSIIVGDAGAEVSMYRNNELFDRGVFREGQLILNSGNEKVIVFQKGFKTSVEYYIDDEQIEIEKIKLKKLKSILKSEEIYNEINPKEKQNKIRLLDFPIPVLLILLGMFLYHLVHNYHNAWHILAVLVTITGYFQLYKVIFRLYTFPILDELIKLPILLVFSMVSGALTQDWMYHTFYA